MAFIARLFFIFLLCSFAQAEVLEFAIIADAGDKTENLLAVKESILRTPVRRLILPGDNLYRGTYESVWDNWHKADPHRTFEFSVVAIGNHTAGYDKEMDYFSKVNPRLFPNKRDYYAVSFDGSVVFFVLNSDNKKNVSEQIGWLDTQLKQAQARFIFIVDHHPAYTVTDHHTWDEVKEFNEKLRLLLIQHKNKITALLVGHDHIASVHKFDSIPVILSGATQETRAISSVMETYRDPTNRKLVELVWKFSQKYPYWARLTLDTTNPDRSSVQFVSALTPRQQAAREESSKRRSIEDVEEPLFGLFSLQNLTKKKTPSSRVPAKTDKSQ